MSRHAQLTAALKAARAAHAAEPTEHTFRALRHAANHLKQWIERQEELTRLRRSAARLYRADEVARLDGLLAKHAMPVSPVGDVKLVDAAGTIRVDLNGRRVFMTRDQALELFMRLGESLEQRS